MGYKAVGALSSAGTVATSLTGVALPTHAAGDLLVIVGIAIGTGDTTCTSSGYSQIAFNEQGTGGDRHRITVLSKVDGGSETNPDVDFSVTANSSIAAFMFSLEDIDAAIEDVAEVDDGSGDTNVLEHTPTGLTTATDAATVVSIVSTSDNNTIGVKSGSEQGFTQRASYDWTSGADGSAGLATKEQATAGAVTMPTWEQTVNFNDTWASISMAFKPSGASVTNALVAIPTPVQVGMTLVRSALLKTVLVDPVSVTLYPQGGYQKIDIVMTGITFSSGLALPVFTGVSGYAARPVPVQVSMSVNPRTLGPATVNLTPVQVGVTPNSPGEIWYELVTVSATEYGYMARDTAEPVLTLVYGLNRSLPVGWSSGEGWQVVSQRFAFNDTPAGRKVVDRAVAGAWASDKLSSQTALTVAMDAALQGAGFRRPGGTNIVTRKKLSVGSGSVGVSLPQVTAP